MRNPLPLPRPAQRSVASYGLHLRPLWRCSHAPPPPNAALRGPIGGPTHCPSGCVRMLFPRPAQRFVAAQGAPPQASAAVFACVSTTQNGASWPQ
eukprot:309209-Pyramimonas_sp.AAC.1